MLNKIHLKRNATDRFALCRISPGHSFVLMATLPRQSAGEVCQTCARVATATLARNQGPLRAGAGTAERSVAVSQLAESAVMETEPERIRKILRDALDAALLERDTASEGFDEILRDISSGDGASRIKSASSALSVARERMSAAMFRLREFEKLRIIPEDLKRKPAQKEAGSAEPLSQSGTD